MNLSSLPECSKCGAKLLQIFILILIFFSFIYFFVHFGASNPATQITTNFIVNLTSPTNWIRFNETALNDSSTAKNLTFAGNQNITEWIRLPKNSNVIDAKLNLSGYNITRTQASPVSTSGWSVNPGNNYDGQPPYPGNTNTYAEIHTAEYPNEINTAYDAKVYCYNFTSNSWSLLGPAHNGTTSLSYSIPPDCNSTSEVRIRWSAEGICNTTGPVYAYAYSNYTNLDLGSDIKLYFNWHQYGSWSLPCRVYFQLSDEYLDFIPAHKYPNNPYLDVANSEQPWEWSYNGEFNHTISKWIMVTSNNVSCSGSWNASYPCSNLYDGDWNSYGKASATSDGLIYVNYSKPDTYYNYKLRIKDFYTDQNYTLPDECINQNPIRLLLSSTSQALPVRVEYYCYNGVDYNTKFTTWYDGIEIYEYTMYWEVPNYDGIPLNATLINNFLSTCTPDVNGNCNLPIKLHSDTAGKIQVSAINVTYDYNISSLYNVVKHSDRYYEIMSNGNLASNDLSLSGYYVKTDRNNCLINGTSYPIQTDANGNKYCGISFAIPKGSKWLNHTIIAGSPFWLNNQTSIPSYYGIKSYFNITWNDSLGYSIDTVLFESNFSGTPTNYTMVLIDPYINATEKKGVYNFNLTLPPGTFYWKSYAKASDGVWNVSDTWYFTQSNQIASCTNINHPNEYYLAQNIIDSSASVCMNITSPNIILDCQGHMIDGVDNPNGFGIYLSSISFTDANITIKNCNISDWAIGIYNDGGNGNISILNNTFISNYQGINEYQAQVDNIIKNNTFYQNNVHIEATYLCGAKIYDNIFKEANQYGIEFVYTMNCTDGGLEEDLIYNNIFNNTNNVYFDFEPASSYNWSISKQPGTNIWNSSLGYIGGNAWFKPDGTGFSETSNCPDYNFDGFCEYAYQLTTNNYDYLPIAKQVGQFPNQPPSVETPKTYDENYVEKTSFANSSKVVIRANVTDPQGASDISKVLITILNSTNNVKVNNATMTSISSIANGYTYEYNYTLPVDADRGTWTIKVYANDTQNAWGSNSTTFSVYLVLSKEVTQSATVSSILQKTVFLTKIQTIISSIQAVVARLNAIISKQIIQITNIQPVLKRIGIAIRISTQTVKAVPTLKEIRIPYISPIVISIATTVTRGIITFKNILLYLFVQPVSFSGYAHIIETEGPYVPVKCSEWGDITIHKCKVNCPDCYSEINFVVPWIKTVTLNNTGNYVAYDFPINATIPKSTNSVNDIKLYDPYGISRDFTANIEEGYINWTTTILPGETQTWTIRFNTTAPEVSEYNETVGIAFTKWQNVSSAADIDYEKVWDYTYLEDPSIYIKFYDNTTGTMEEFTGKSAWGPPVTKDLSGNGFADYAQWMIPKISANTNKKLVIKSTIAKVSCEVVNKTILNAPVLAWENVEWRWDIKCMNSVDITLSYSQDFRIPLESSRIYLDGKPTEPGFLTVPPYGPYVTLSGSIGPHENRTHVLEFLTSGVTVDIPPASFPSRFWVGEKANLILDITAKNWASETINETQTKINIVYGENVKLFREGFLVDSVDEVRGYYTLKIYNMTPYESRSYMLSYMTPVADAKVETYSRRIINSSQYLVYPFKVWSLASFPVSPLWIRIKSESPFKCSNIYQIWEVSESEFLSPTKPIKILNYECENTNTTLVELSPLTLGQTRYYDVFVLEVEKPIMPEFTKVLYDFFETLTNFIKAFIEWLVNLLGGKK